MVVQFLYTWQSNATTVHYKIHSGHIYSMNFLYPRRTYINFNLLKRSGIRLHFEVFSAIQV